MNADETQTRIQNKYSVTRIGRMVTNCDTTEQFYTSKRRQQRKAASQLVNYTLQSNADREHNGNQTEQQPV